MKARPTSLTDLVQMRSHRWDRSPVPDAQPVTYCTDCGVSFTVSTPIGDVPACPGPDYELRRRGAHEAPGGPS